MAATKLKAFQRVQYRFAAHLRDPKRNPAPRGIEPRRMKIYRELFYNNVEGFLANAFPVLRRITPDARWHVEDRAPVLGREAIVAARAGDARPLRFVPQGREAATSGDLAYTYGAIDAAGTPAGHYLHVWTRGIEGAWRLLVAVHLTGG